MIDIRKFIKREGAEFPEFPLEGKHSAGTKTGYARNGQPYTTYAFTANTIEQIAEAYVEWASYVGPREIEWRQFPETTQDGGRFYIRWRCLVKEPA